MGKVVKGVVKAVKKVAKAVAPVAGVAVGVATGNPALGAAVGAATGAAKGGIKGAIMGGITAYGGTTALNAVTGGASFLPGSSSAAFTNGIALADAAGAGTAAFSPVAAGAAAAAAPGVTLSMASFDTALAASSGFWPSVSSLVNTAGNVVKTVQAVNSLTGQTMRIGAGDSVPNGWYVPPQTPQDTAVPTNSTSPLGAVTSTGNVGASTPASVNTQPVQTSSGSIMPLLLIGGAAFLVLRKKG